MFIGVLLLTYSTTAGKLAMGLGVLAIICTGSRYGGDDMRDRQRLQLPNYVRVLAYTSGHVAVFSVNTIPIDC